MTSERHVIADYEVLAADPEELTELHTCDDKGRIVVRGARMCFKQTRPPVSPMEPA